MISKVKHIHALTSIKRERVLPVAGHVLVRRMQKVSPSDVIVVAPLVSQFVLMDIAQGLNVNPARADELLQRQAGEDLVQGDVIAGPVGLFKRVVRAPQEGMVRIAGEGKVLYEISSPDFELQAGMEGTITNIIPERGAIIETKGALIQGVWGNGKTTYGVVQPTSNDLLKELVVEQLNIGFRGAIITAGFCRSPEVLEAAGIVPVKGLILGSMSANLIPLAKKMDYPIMIVDGFRETPMNKAAEKILIENKDKNIALNAQELDTFQGNFPEGIISQSSTSEPDLPSEAETLKAGKKVIIINGPQAPQIGEIEKIISGKQVLSNGVETQLAEVTLANEKSTIIPLTNLEIIND
ncbi:MAG: hypothetical protein DRI65_12580 [Chloroflexota bacterium]|nr:MAG: hypothetical protein DRI65_12580 [Chloroflexota bacterium]